MQDPTALDYWTLAIAIIGAATGLAALATQVWSVALAGPRIKVGVAVAVSTAQGEWLVSIDATNVGRMPVTVADYGLAFKHDRGWMRATLQGMHPQHWQGPHGTYRLDDGDSVNWLVDRAVVADIAAGNGIRYLHGYMTLATGKRVISRSKIDAVTVANL